MEIFVEENDVGCSENYVRAKDRYFQLTKIPQSHGACDTVEGHMLEKKRMATKAKEFNWSPKEVLSREHYFAVTS